MTASARVKDFADNDSITYDEAAAVMSKAGIADGDFQPVKTLTGCAFMKMVPDTGDIPVSCLRCPGTVV